MKTMKAISYIPFMDRNFGTDLSGIVSADIRNSDNFTTNIHQGQIYIKSNCRTFRFRLAAIKAGKTKHSRLLECIIAISSIRSIRISAELMYSSVSLLTLENCVIALKWNIEFCFYDVMWREPFR